VNKQKIENANTCEYAIELANYQVRTSRCRYLILSHGKEQNHD